MQVHVLVKDTHDFPQDIAHLYEHWFIMSFYKFASEQAGMHGGAIGYLGGETYNNIIFIEAWFYDAAASRLFETFSANETLDPALLTVCMRQCQAEDRVLWEIDDRPLLDSQLAGLRQLPWRPGKDVSPFVYDDTSANDQLPITIHKAAARYRAVTARVNLQAASLEDQAVFLRLYVIIEDIIGQFAQQQGWQVTDSLPPRQIEDSLYTIIGMSLPRGGPSNRQIGAELTAYLRQFDVAGQMHLLRAHFVEYARQPLW